MIGDDARAESASADAGAPVQITLKVENAVEIVADTDMKAAEDDEQANTSTSCDKVQRCTSCMGALYTQRKCTILIK